MYMDKFDKLLEKKGKKLSSLEQRAKGDVLSGLQEQSSDSYGDKLAGLKKVSVAAPSAEGLSKGLDKAKELLGHTMDEEDAQEESTESPFEESAEENKEPITPEEIDEKIQMLMDLKNEMLKKRE